MIRETSREAHQDIVSVMALGLRQKVCQVLVNACGDRTASEICHCISGARLNSISPRMKELIARDLVEEVGTRCCGITGHKAIAYRLTGREEQTPVKKRKPTKKQIEAMFQKGRNSMSGTSEEMTYLTGVQRALGWVLGHYEDLPDQMDPAKPTQALGESS